MALQPGHLFGNYRIVRLLGGGGFGEVYLNPKPSNTVASTPMLGHGFAGASVAETY